jgi:hypothetical protein
MVAHNTGVGHKMRCALVVHSITATRKVRTLIVIRLSGNFRKRYEGRKIWPH